MDVVKRKFMSLFIYSCKKKARDFTKTYLRFTLFAKIVKTPFIDVQVGSKYFFK